MLPEDRIVFVSKEWLLQELLSDTPRVVILDCRTTNEYGESHIRHAVNFSIPSIMLRRLAAGKIDLLSTVRCRNLKEKLSHAYRHHIFVVYGDQVGGQLNDTIHTLIKRLLKDGCQAVCLRESFMEFQRAYPEWCESCIELLDSPESGTEMDAPLMGLRTLRITSAKTRRKVRSMLSGSTDDSSSDSEQPESDPPYDERHFPVEIIPYLYLGNAANSKDLQALKKHSIQYVLNVTTDIPNKFEADKNLTYLQLPIDDHWSQDLTSIFPRAIKFIDEGRSQKKGVLVHCLAGVSRSVTITVAYLMWSQRLSMNDAFGMVRSRKASISPNFHFMEQLLQFEYQLASKPVSFDEESEDQPCECGNAECARCRTTRFKSFKSPPDSGIELDIQAAPAPQ